MNSQDKLDALRRLEIDWDSYGAPKITDEAIHTASNLMFVPTARGGIQIELHINGSDLEIEIAPDGSVISFFWEK